ncbi:hypothetical protein [Verrucomicrobium spinosum]|uniref:hypothetical protein n=1 Tax=Verrucomicrobium spinosum TaxID=2736 RepID=UPI0009463618|nr:hypothetical protein [Verrucomicrobium spinosum]
MTAEKESAGTARTAGEAYKARLAAFDDAASQFAPKNLKYILAKVSTVIDGLAVGKVSDWDGAGKALQALKEKRPEANKEKIDALSKAIVVLEMSSDHALQTDLEELASKSKKLKEVSAGIADAAKSDIIDGGLTFFAAHPDEESCPLCEQTLPETVGALVLRLNTRSAALRELKEAQSARNTSLAKVRTSLGAIVTLIARDLGHAEQLLRDAVESLKVAKADAEALLEAAKTSDELTPPASLQDLTTLRAGCLADLKTKKEALVAPDSSKLEGAIAFVERAIASAEVIRAACDEDGRATEVARRAKFANAAFKKSREFAIEEVFARISGTVLAFYKKLHDSEEQNERSECTGLELKPDSRAAAGGLKLAIQFLELADPKDPRAFLSEGHLDSLGLCIFLATVKIFNPTGTMLVLDDVLTSIDKDHRHRVGELLFDEFHEYQILLTTHDEYWFDLLKSLSRARGIQGTWKFTKVEGWTVERGPTLSVSDDSWAFINANLNEASYRALGGPLRLVLEDFLKRAAVKLESKVKFKIDGKYTSGDFAAAGIQDDIRKKLAAAVKADAAAATTEAAVQTAVGRVFGTGDLINFLSHDNPGRLEVTFPQAQDFVSGLKFLIDQCARYSLMRGQ